MPERSFRDELDDRFTRRQWRVQRAGWLLMLLIVVAALFGAFGTSPLAGRVVAVDQDGAHYEVEYPRITRYQHLDRLHVRVHAPDAQGDELVIAFSNAFIESTRLGSSSPEADGGGAGADGGFYSFNVTDWSQPIVITIEMEPRKAFHTAGAITISAGGLAPARLDVPYWAHP